MGMWTRTFVQESAPTDSVQGDLWYKTSSKQVFIITEDRGTAFVEIGKRGVVVPAITNAPAGGTGATGGAYDTSGNRDAMITALNGTLNTLRSQGLIA